MQSLPSLDCDQTRHLPLFDFTARRLVTVFLREPGDSQLELLQTVVADDPVLALWIALRVEATSCQPLHSVAEAAAWLADCWSMQLQWPERHLLESSSGDSTERDSRWQQRLLQTVLTARLTRHLIEAAGRDSADQFLDAEHAYWVVLLQQSCSWVVDCFEEEDPQSVLPSWIPRDQGEKMGADKGFREGHLQHYLQAAEQLTDRVLQGMEGSPPASPPSAAETVPLPAREAACADELPAEVLQGHLDYVTSRIELPDVESYDAAHILNRLGRLDQLENQFAEIMEQEKLAALKELAYGASHEINNPLANISSRAQTLLRDESDPERKRMLATINSQAFRANEMISDMMLFAKPPQMDRKTVDLVQLINEVVAELADDADRQGTGLRFQGSQTPIVISIDEVQFAEALKALCRNSLEAMGAGGQVDVSAAPMAPLRLAVKQPDPNDAGLPAPTAAEPGSPVGAVITVKDNGPGISAQVRAHLFDPFFSGREAGRGLGFGLAKCWRIMTEHDGQVEVHSSETEGTTFTLRFPAVCDESPQGETGASQAEAG